MALSAGHTFVIFLDNGFPVNILNAVKNVSEVCRVHARPPIRRRSSWPRRTRGGRCWEW